VTQPGGLYNLAESRVGALLYTLNADSQEYLEALPKAKAEEVRLAVADVKCRAQLADQISSILSPVFDKWASHNSEQIKIASELWKAG
jgi:hypothetical protein